MLIKNLKDYPEFIAEDKTVLRELLHPDKMEVECRYSLAHAIVKPKISSTPHALKTTEVYYILEGEGSMHIGDESAQVRAGDMLYIPPNAKQFITNSGATDLKFLCIVDPAWRPEDEIIF
jgi:mannose-6-phosphate isomerase-like protein (cupin superfamily)